MTALNPNNPATAGLEWFPTRLVPKALSATQLLGVDIPSTAAESVQSIWPMLQRAPGGGSACGCDIYPAADVFDPNEVYGGLALPGADGANTAGWLQASPGISGGAFMPYGDPTAPNGWNFINDIIYDHIAGSEITASTDEKLSYLPAGAQTQGHVEFQLAASPVWFNANDGTAGNDPTGDRIARVDIRVTARSVNATNGRMDGRIVIGGVAYPSESGIVVLPGGGAFAVYRFTFDWHPVRGDQWRASDLAEFASGGANKFALYCFGGAPLQIVIGGASLVFRALPEHRVATATMAAPSSDAAQWVELALANPATGAPAAWAKANGTTYRHVFYARGSDVSLIGVDSANLAGHETESLDAWQGIIQKTYAGATPNADPTIGPWFPAVFMTKAGGGALGANLQPYAQPRLLPCSSSSAACRQTIANHSSVDHGGISFVVSVPAGAVPTAALSVKIRRSSDDVQMGATLSLAPGEVPQDGKLHLVTRRLAANATLASGTAYYLEFTTASTVPWQIAAAATDFTDSTTPGTLAAGGSIPGSATWDGAANLQLDVLANVQTSPPAPTGFAGAPATYAPAALATGAAALIGYAALSWTPTALGGSFGYYELQRLDAGAWTPIFFGLSEASAFFNDTEGRRGQAESYRLRVIRADGALSAFTATVVVTAAQIGDDCDLVLASNANPDLALAYKDAPGHRYTRPNADTAVSQLIEGRPAPFVFRALVEGRSDVFSRRLLVAMDTNEALLTSADREPFDELVALLEADLPYIAVLDGRPRRWFAAAKIDALDFDQPVNQHHADVTFTENATVAAPVEAAVPWAP